MREEHAKSTSRLPESGVSLGEDQAHLISRRFQFGVFLALLILLAISVGAAELHLGSYGLFAALMIASAKAALILLYFMHLRGSSVLIWLFAISGFYWLAILLTLTMADYFTRGI